MVRYVPIKPPVLGFILQHTHKRSLNFLSDPIKKVYLHFHILYQNTKVNHFNLILKSSGGLDSFGEVTEDSLALTDTHTHTPKYSCIQYTNVSEKFHTSLEI